MDVNNVIFFIFHLQRNREMVTLAIGGHVATTRTSGRSGVKMAAVIGSCVILLSRGCAVTMGPGRYWIFQWV